MKVFFRVASPLLFLFSIFLMSFTGCGNYSTINWRDEPTKNFPVSWDDNNATVVSSVSEQSPTIGPKPTATSVENRKIGRIYVVAVGISNYYNTSIEALRYADRDASEFVEQIMAVSDGAINPQFVRVLLNEQATLRNVKEALSNFLQNAIAEDLVYIYFSGHGSPEPNNQKNMYFLTYDTDPKNMPVTAYPMWEIEIALSRFIKAERVVIIADTCHSGGIGPSYATRGGGYSKDTGSEVNTYLHALAESGKGRTILTASEPNELSMEDASWGGGHGVFTYYLLEGLKGQADIDRDGIVTLGELADFVDSNVRRATNSRQHPFLSGEINRNLPVAIVH